MCKVTILRELMKQRLNVAVEGIFQLFERTILAYEEELRQTKEEKERQGALLDAALKSQGGFHREEVHQVVLEESPQVGPSEWQQQEKVKKEKVEECLQNQSVIKMEMEEENIPSCQDGKQLTGREMTEIGINTFSLNDVHLKDEGHSSEFQHEVVGKHCEESDNIAPLSDMDDGVSVKTDTSGVPLENSESYAPQPANGSPPSFSQCAKAFDNMRNSRQCTKTRTSYADAPFSCAMCNKAFTLQSNLTIHLKTHMNVRPFACAVCGNAFTRRHHLKRHMNTHARGKRVPGQYDVQQVLVEGPQKVPSEQVLNQSHNKKANKGVWSSQDGEELHRLVETGVNTFPWTVVRLKCEEDEVLTTTPHHPSVEKLNPAKADGEDCGEFTSTAHVDIPAASSETDGQPFLCRKAFVNMRTLGRHPKTHNAANWPFVCRVCKTTVSRRQHLKRHMDIHTRDKRVSGQRTQKSRVGVPKPSMAERQSRSGQIQTRHKGTQETLEMRCVRSTHRQVKKRQKSQVCH
ncbi:uncharacterized protein LOC144062312 [Vanacampus margaritifer]